MYNKKQNNLEIIFSDYLQQYKNSDSTYCQTFSKEVNGEETTTTVITSDTLLSVMLHSLRFSPTAISSIRSRKSFQISNNVKPTGQLLDVQTPDGGIKPEYKCGLLFSIANNDPIMVLCSHPGNLNFATTLITDSITNKIPSGPNQEETALPNEVTIYVADTSMLEDQTIYHVPFKTIGQLSEVEEKIESFSNSLPISVRENSENESNGM